MSHIHGCVAMRNPSAGGLPIWLFKSQIPQIWLFSKWLAFGFFRLAFSVFFGFILFFFMKSWYPTSFLHKNTHLPFQCAKNHSLEQGKGWRNYILNAIIRNRPYHNYIGKVLHIFYLSRSYVHNSDEPTCAYHLRKKFCQKSRRGSEREKRPKIHSTS